MFWSFSFFHCSGMENVESMEVDNGSSKGKAPDACDVAGDSLETLPNKPEVSSATTLAKGPDKAFPKAPIAGTPLSPSRKVGGVKRGIMCPFRGCKVVLRRDKLPNHSFRFHLPLCFKRESSEFWQRMRGVRVDALFALSRELGVRGLIGLFDFLFKRWNCSIKTQFQLELVDDMIHLSKEYGWHIPPRFGLSPPNSPAVLIHWRPLLFLVGQLPRTRQIWFKNKFSVPSVKEEPVPTSQECQHKPASPSAPIAAPSVVPTCSSEKCQVPIVQAQSAPIAMTIPAGAGVATSVSVAMPSRSAPITMTIPAGAGVATSVPVAMPSRSAPIAMTIPAGAGVATSVPVAMPSRSAPIAMTTPANAGVATSAPAAMQSKPAPIAMSGPDEPDSPVLTAFDAHYHPDRLSAHLGHVTEQQLAPPRVPVRVIGGVMNFCDPGTYSQMPRLVGHPWHLAIGIHPSRAGSYTADDFAYLEQTLSSRRVSGISEVGLDYNLEPSTWDSQMHLLNRILGLGTLGYVLIMHIRGPRGNPDLTRLAYRKVFKQVRLYCSVYQRIHLHSFSGDLETMNEWVSNFPKCYVSFSGLLRVFTSDQLSALRHCPSERLLIETDSPYLPLRTNVGVNTPNNIGDIAAAVAEIRNVPLMEILQRTSRNGRILYLGVQESNA
ncbi:uncharacterized protein LOC121426781 [Lytechinus variegatus]|uniref:uncharacterized protein LOC121426781 n=1 Tax=Lytechinus variegatus TaxID=7654 RepID=UPI001BB0EF78|nr:uncharacterized protein LOC121426781 [Lytechinus variegatus]